MMDAHTPLESLQQGSWFKLICGASSQYLPTIRSAVLAYALAGADCIDVAADPAVIEVAKEALQISAMLRSEAIAQGFTPLKTPWLMVSLNDGEDPHFRKAEFTAITCPADCARPCEQICPAHAIVFQDGLGAMSGVLDERCYGCGRCLPVCPFQKITTRTYVSAPSAIASLVLQLEIDALEIHTQVGRLQDFQRLWQAILPWIHRLKLVAISCPDGEGFIDYLWSLYNALSPLPCPLIWQTDGRPMSGDIGKGTTHAAIKLGQKVLVAGPPGYVQLAGGTNHHTVTKLEALALCKPDSLPLAANSHLAGVAYGSYARTLLMPLLETLDARQEHQHIEPQYLERRMPTPLAKNLNLENHPDLLWPMVRLAHTLVSPLKRLGSGQLTLR
jgi:Fe-S-cluster-containing hydrogenase component 2